MSMPERIVFLCGVIDEASRLNRHITNANPAATQKVFNFCAALRAIGAWPLVLSLGRGRQDGSGRAFPAIARRVDQIAVIYARFVHSPLTTHFVSAISLALLVMRLRRRGKITLIAYNRLWHYVPALLVARLTGTRCYLDLEDGAVRRGRHALLMLLDRLGTRCFDVLCSDGVLLANRALQVQTTIRRSLVWYGTTPSIPALARWQVRPLGIMLGGTLNHERGCEVFMQAVRLLMQQRPELRKCLRFFVTGHGPMCAELEQLAAASDGWVQYEGLVGRDRYLEILGACHAGLMLNLSTSDMSHTTFPSKVLEYAAAGLLVIATRVSDVATLLGDGCVLLADESPEALAAALTALCVDPDAAAQTAGRGAARLRIACDPRRVASDIRQFLGGGT